MTILDYIATHPGCSGGEIAAAQVVALAKQEARLLTT